MSVSKVCVFCGASNEYPVECIQLGYDFGKELARRGYTLVWGASNSGIMGSVARGCSDCGGNLIGIAPEFMREIEAPYVPDEYTGSYTFIETKDMSERKNKMFEIADAFVILPGGYGTMDELFEILTNKQLGLSNKPVTILNYKGYYDELVKWIEGEKPVKILYNVVNIG